MKYGFVLMIGLLTACSSDPSKSTTTNGNTAQNGATADEANKGIVCTYEIPVGSTLREKHCTTPGEREAARRQGEQLQTLPAPGTKH